MTMIGLLIFWFVTFTSLMLTLGLLSWIYNAFGGDLGLTSWRRETTIAAVISLIQGLLFWAALSLGIAVGRMLVLTVIVSSLSYKLTHLSSDLFEGTSEMDGGSIAGIAAVQFAILFGLGIGVSMFRYAPH
jgi:hypothetical protein